MQFFLFISKALSEKNGTPSSIRILNAVTLISFVSVISFGFIRVVFFHSDLIVSYLTILAGIIIGILGLKVYQKKSEL